MENKLKKLGLVGILGASLAGGCVGVANRNGAMFIDARELLNQPNYQAPGIGEALFSANNFHGDLNGNGIDASDFDGIKSTFDRNESIKIYLFTRAFRGQSMVFEVEGSDGSRDVVPLYFPPNNLFMYLSINGNNKLAGNYLIRVRKSDGAEIGHTNISLR